MQIAVVFFITKSNGLFLLQDKIKIEIYFFMTKMVVNLTYRDFFSILFFDILIKVLKIKLNIEYIKLKL
jgi:hypothetical protein